MGDDDPGAAGGVVQQGVDDLVFGDGVEAGQRVVEDEQPAVAGQYPGEAQALPLAPGQGRGPAGVA